MKIFTEINKLNKIKKVYGIRKKIFINILQNLKKYFLPHKNKLTANIIKIKLLLNIIIRIVRFPHTITHLLLLQQKFNSLIFEICTLSIHFIKKLTLNNKNLNN